MTTIPYYSTPALTFEIAQREAAQMRRVGALPPLPQPCSPGCDGCCKSADDLGCYACGCGSE